MNLLRQVDRVLYRLERSFGVSIIYKSVGVVTQDLETGLITKPTTSYTIPKGILYQGQQSSEYIQVISRLFNRDATIDPDQRYLLLRKKSLPSGLVPKIGDSIEYAAISYEIIASQETIQDTGAYFLTLKALKQGN